MASSVVLIWLERSWTPQGVQSLFTIFDEVLTPGFTCFSLEVALVEGLGEGESVVSVPVLLSCLRVLMPFFLSCSLLGEYDCLTPGDYRLEWSFSAKKVIFFLIRIA